MPATEYGRQEILKLPFLDDAAQENEHLYDTPGEGFRGEPPGRIAQSTPALS